MKLKNTFNDKNSFNSIYRGYVVWNDDPKNKGRIKVFIPGVYSNKYSKMPEYLPWALPMSPVFGGGSTNITADSLNDEVGWCSVPHAGDISTGSQVFVFFENGDINYPIYFGVAQSGNGWFSEHPNQHCFRSDNVKIRVDENTSDKRSTCKFDSYNTHNTSVSKANLERTCKKNSWKFEKSTGNISQLETRIDIEVKAENMNAVNLNIHGNVNMHIDGNWFVDHIGDYYEYRKGDRYIKQDGNTYIEENGVYRKILNGSETYEHNGNYVENQKGDTLITRTGKLHEHIDNNVTRIYNQNYKIVVKNSIYESCGNDMTVNIGNDYYNFISNNFNQTVINSYNISSDKKITIKAKNNVSIKSVAGNILLKTEGDFELMKKNVITAEGFKNIGSKGNIQLISTFGNINLQCVKNDILANFNQKSTIIPWNPSFVNEVLNDTTSYTDFNEFQQKMKGMNFDTDIRSYDDWKKLFDYSNELGIYDGLPVFHNTKMIVQNPNINGANNESDLSWIPKFRSEATDWRNNNSSVMWKIPSKLMGNINIETWSGDINIKNDSSLGCAGNINISAKESGGTLPGYKIGTIDIHADSNEKVFADPRDLFLDSDFMSKKNGEMKLFVHGTDDMDKSEILPRAYSTLVESTDYEWNFVHSNFYKFYDLYSENIITNGYSFLNNEENDAMAKKISELNELEKSKTPKLGCLKCITDYLMGIPGVQDKVYEKVNIDELPGGTHKYGFQRLNPKNTLYSRGTFNIGDNIDFENISLGDGHAIDNGFMNKDYASNNFGAINISTNGNFNEIIGRNYHKSISTNKINGILDETYIYTEEFKDYNVPDSIKEIISSLDKKYRSYGYDYVTPSSNIILAKKCGDEKIIESNFTNIENLNNLTWQDHGFKVNHTINCSSLGNDSYRKSNSSTIDFTTSVDYGFDFEHCADLLDSKEIDGLSISLTENSLFSTNKNEGSFTENTVGGSTKSFKISNFDESEHIEVNLNSNFYNYSLTDISSNYKKVYNYDDYCNVWWDFNFKNDKVPFFPDVEFSTEITDYTQYFDKLYKSVTCKSWSNYGNHIKGNSHIDYAPTTLTGENKFIYKNENYVNTASLLWKNKREEGVEINFNDYSEAEKINNNFSLNSPSSHKNQNIIKNSNMIASNNLISYKNRTGSDLVDYDLYFKGNLNKHHITQTAGLNENIIKLNAENVYLKKTDLNKLENQNYELYSGNIMKTEMTGNNKFKDYSESSKTISVKDCFNEFKLSQNGFIKNTISILNGNNTNMDSTNELYILNGAEDLSENSQNNTISINNGMGTMSGSNNIILSNGDNLIDGSNVIRISNNENEENDKYKDNVFNSITINNDNQKQNIILSDEYSDNVCSNQIISLYSDGIIANYSLKNINLKSADIFVNSEKLIENAEESYSLNSKKIKIESESYSLESNTINNKGETISINANKVTVSNIIATGTFSGNSYGYFNGEAGQGNEKYSLLWPIDHYYSSSLGSSQVIPAISFTSPEIKEYVHSISNKENSSENGEAKSISLISIIKSKLKSVLKFELEFLKK